MGHLDPQPKYKLASGFIFDQLKLNISVIQQNTRCCMSPLVRNMLAIDGAKGTQLHK